MKLKKIISTLMAVTAASSITLFAVGCGGEENWTPPTNEYEYTIPQDYCRTYYEIFVRSFADGNGDGIGDFRGLINNLDYLNDGDDSTMTDLGINGIWLMPFNASPSYHGYDVSDYMTVNSNYGTLDDFDELVEECEKRGIWIQMDLVLNHTSSQHQWFKNALIEARQGIVEPEESEFMKKYVFYHKSEKPSSGTYYEVSNSDYVYLANFSSGMPDLNLEDRTTNGLEDEIKEIVDFWLDRGVRSFRLDAVPWACANNTMYSAANGEFWTWFNDYCNTKGAEVFGKPDDGIEKYCYNVGEVWDSYEMSIKPFFGTGMSNFNYDMGDNSNSGFNAVANGFVASGAAGLVSRIASMQKDVLELDSAALLSNFLSNHDNNRSAGTFMYDATKIKVAAGLYLLMPGNPYIYYGEEIGAEGNGIDENKRLPFNWGDESKGITSNPPGTTYNSMTSASPYETYKASQRLGTWASQTNDKNSILTYYRNAIRLRNRFPEIGRGIITPYGLDAQGKLMLSDEAIGNQTSLAKVNPANKNLAAYTLEYKGSKILLLQNVGDSAISVDLTEFGGYDVAGELSATGGNVSLSGSKLNLSAYTIAVLKAD